MTPWDKILVGAERLVQKSATPLSEAQAIDRFLKSGEGRELYGQYLAAQPSLVPTPSSVVSIAKARDIAWEKIVALATSAVEKSTEELSEAQAIDIFLKTDEGRQLYAQYLGAPPKPGPQVIRKSAASTRTPQQEQFLEILRKNEPIRKTNSTTSDVARIAKDIRIVKLA